MAVSQSTADLRNSTVRHDRRKAKCKVRLVASKQLRTQENTLARHAENLAMFYTVREWDRAEINKEHLKGIG